jgi:hypothetical protein
MEYAKDRSWISTFTNPNRLNNTYRILIILRLNFEEVIRSRILLIEETKGSKAGGATIKAERRK